MRQKAQFMDSGASYRWTLFATLGFEGDANECALATSVIRAAAPDIVFVVLGLPNQEIWSQKHATQLKIQALCVGAGLDFIAGRHRRAPPVFRHIGCEWQTNQVLMLLTGYG